MSRVELMIENKTQNWQKLRKCSCSDINVLFVNSSSIVFTDAKHNKCGLSKVYFSVSGENKIGPSLMEARVILSEFNLSLSLY